jgi:hypothetical protein
MLAIINNNLVNTLAYKYLSRVLFAKIYYYCNLKNENIFNKLICFNFSMLATFLIGTKSRNFVSLKPTILQFEVIFQKTFKSMDLEDRVI